MTGLIHIVTRVHLRSEPGAFMYGRTIDEAGLLNHLNEKILLASEARARNTYMVLLTPGLSARGYRFMEPGALNAVSRRDISIESLRIVVLIMGLRLEQLF